MFVYTDPSKHQIAVFVYNPAADITFDADSQQWAAREGSKFAAVQEEQRRRGRIAAYTPGVSDTTWVDVGSSRFLRHLYVIPVRLRNGAIFVEMQYFYSVAGKLVQIRATLPQSDWMDSRAPLFARDLISVIAPPGASQQFDRLVHR
jgi:hypothetical protein